MSGPIIGYHVSGLRVGADLHAEVQQSCAAIARGLGGLAIDAAIFGGVPAAAGFHAAALEVRDGQAVAAGREARRRAELTTRTRTVSAVGAELTAGTAAVARTGAAGGASGGFAGDTGVAG